MKLNNENIKEWKEELSKISKPFNDVFGCDLSLVLADKEWIEDYQDMTPEEALQENLRDLC